MSDQCPRCGHEVSSQAAEIAVDTLLANPDVLRELAEHAAWMAVRHVG